MKETRQLQLHQLAHRIWPHRNRIAWILSLTGISLCLIAAALLPSPDDQLHREATQTGLIFGTFFLNLLRAVLMIGCMFLFKNIPLFEFWLENKLIETLGGTPNSKKWEEAWPEKAHTLRLLKLDANLRQAAHAQMTTRKAKV